MKSRRPLDAAAAARNDPKEGEERDNCNDDPQDRHFQRPFGELGLILAPGGDSSATRSGDLDPLQRGERPLVARGEPAPELFERERVGLIADVAERPLEIFDQREAEGFVRNRPGDDVVELTAAAGKLLRGTDPAFRGRRERPEKLGEALFVV